MIIYDLYVFNFTKLSTQQSICSRKTLFQPTTGGANLLFPPTHRGSALLTLAVKEMEREKCLASD